MIIATPVVFEKLRFQNVFSSVHTNIKRTASVFPPIWRAFSSVDVRPNRWNKDAFSNCFLPIVDGKLLRFQSVDGAYKGMFMSSSHIFVSDGQHLNCSFYCFCFVSCRLGPLFKSLMKAMLWTVVTSFRYTQGTPLRYYLLVKYTWVID